MRIGFDLQILKPPDFNKNPLFDIESIKGDLFVIGSDFESIKYIESYTKKVTLLYNVNKIDEEEFKEKMINDYDIDIFFESDYKQYKYLLEATKNAKIIYWESFIVDSITNLCQRI